MDVVRIEACLNQVSYALEAHARLVQTAKVQTRRRRRVLFNEVTDSGPTLKCAMMVTQQVEMAEAATV